MFCGPFPFRSLNHRTPLPNSLKETDIFIDSSVVTVIDCGKYGINVKLRSQATFSTSFEVKRNYVDRSLA